MSYDGRGNRMRRQEAVGMDELVRQFIREMRLSAGLNRQRIEEVWNEISGASRYTLISYMVTATTTIWTSIMILPILQSLSSLL